MNKRVVSLKLDRIEMCEKAREGFCNVRRKLKFKSGPRRSYQTLNPFLKSCLSSINSFFLLNHILIVEVKRDLLTKTT